MAVRRPGRGGLRWPWRLLDAASAAATVPLPFGPTDPALDPARLGAGAAVLVGVEPASGVPLVLDRFSGGSNPTRLVVGTSGAGKSYAAKLELTRQLAAGVHAVVVDPEGEFGEIARVTGRAVSGRGGGTRRAGPGRARLPPRASSGRRTGGAGVVGRSAARGTRGQVDLALLDRALDVLRADRPATTATGSRVGRDRSAARDLRAGGCGPSTGDLLAVISDLAAYPPFVGADLPPAWRPLPGAPSRGCSPRTPTWPTRRRWSCSTCGPCPTGPDPR